MAFGYQVLGFGAGGVSSPFIKATGGTITTADTDYKVHTFTGPGSFAVTSVGSCTANNEVSYIVLAGGGGGGIARAGAGGAGGFREDKSGVDTYTASPLDGATPITVTATSFPITVGAGGGAGAGSACAPAPAYVAATPGSNSIFSTTTSTGGGKGGSHSPPSSP
jgi:hypothetical protein